MANKRVNELTEKSVVDGSDYLIVDSAAGGTKKLQMSTLIATLNGLAISVVSELPTTDIDTHTLYLVPKTNPESPDVYNEYMYINNAWELIGSTEVNLTNYYTKTEVDTALTAKQDELTFDSAPTASSDNPVKSGGIKTALDAKQDTLTFDNAPTASSDNPVKSGGIKTALDAKQDTLTFDNAPTASSDNPVKSGGIKTALDAKQDTLTFDNAPTASSDNPVKSGGIKTALDAKQDTLTFDNAPTASSDNPVKSGGIKTALDAKQDTLTAGDNITIDANNRISASSVGTKYTKTVDLAKTDSRTIAFNPTGYNYAATDTVDVYINGLHGIQGTDYTLSVSGTSLSIILTLAGTTGVTEKIEIIVIK